MKKYYLSKTYLYMGQPLILLFMFSRINLGWLKWLGFMQLLLFLWNLASRSLPINGSSFSWINRAYFNSTKFIDIILTSHSYSFISNCSLPQTDEFTNIFYQSSWPFLFLNCPISLFLQKCTIFCTLLLFLQLYYSLSV